MLSAHAIASGTRYAEYLQAEAVEQSYWEGEGARLLGLSGEVKPSDFALVVEGKDPYSREQLRSRPRYDLRRLNEHGEKQIYARQRGVYDLVLSTPKSVSIVAMIDARLQDAHRQTVCHIQPRIERLAMTRVRRDYRVENRPTGNLVQGIWQHNYSRALDPQIHTHLATISTTYDKTEHCWKALQAQEIYRHIPELTLRYRQNLRERVASLGYVITEYPDKSFEISSVGETLMDRLSQRSAHREAAKEEFREQHHREPTDREVKELLRAQRPDKEYLPLPVIRDAQLARLTPSERTDLLRIRDQALENSEHIQKSNRLRIHIGSDAYDEGPEVKRWSYGQRISL